MLPAPCGHCARCGSPVFPPRHSPGARQCRCTPPALRPPHGGPRAPAPDARPSERILAVPSPHCQPSRGRPTRHRSACLAAEAQPRHPPLSPHPTCAPTPTLEASAHRCPTPPLKQCLGCATAASRPAAPNRHRPAPLAAEARPPSSGRPARLRSVPAPTLKPQAHRRLTPAPRMLARPGRHQVVPGPHAAVRRAIALCVLPLGCAPGLRHSSPGALLLRATRWSLTHHRLPILGPGSRRSLAPGPVGRGQAVPGRAGLQPRESRQGARRPGVPAAA